MRLVSTPAAKFLLTLIILVLSGAARAEEPWPLKRDIDLSSGFGDYRRDRFHAGVDIRTGGVEGAPILSPVAGYVYRVKMSYIGYGKGLYIMGDDGYLYVYGHLSSLAAKIESPVKLAQLAIRRYYQDLYFPKDSIRINKGEFLGKTGKTGTSAPHLHFEKRSGENYPLNPLSHGFSLEDKVKPSFTRIGFKMTDDHSLFMTGSRELFCDVKSVNDSVYRVDSLLYFQRPFGIMVDCFDQARPGGMKLAVYKLSLLVDDTPLYQVIFDSLSFDEQASANLEYDYASVVNDRKRVRLLYGLSGNGYHMSGGTSGANGVVGLDWKDAPGKHKGRVIAEDCFGNRSELRFNFLWGPPDNIFTLDSAVATPPKTTTFYFTPVSGSAELGIDSVKVFINRGNVWGETEQATATLQPDGKLVCVADAYGISKAVLRLGAFADGTLIPDNLFNGLQEYGKEIATLQHEILDDGLLLTLNVQAKQGALARFALFDGDTLLGVEYPQYFTMLQQRCFIPPLKKYQHITKIGYAVTRDTSIALKYVDTLNIYLVGTSDNQAIQLGDSTTIRFRTDGFFAPRYVELKLTGIRNRSLLKLNSDYFRIDPPAFVCKKDFEVDMRLQRHPIITPKSGICWLDEKADRWIWLDNTVDSANYAVKATAEGGGLFAALFDMDPPEIEQLNIKDRREYTNPILTISFVLNDSLSGFQDDRNITIKLDGQWLIPEFDPITGICKTTPNEPLTNGSHHLGIVVTDRAGNKTEQYLNFMIRAKR